LRFLKSAVRQGEKDSAKGFLKAAVDAGISTQKIIDDALTAAMTEIGDGYGAGKIFLPQVMMAAEAMQAAFNTLKEISPAADTKAKGTFCHRHRRRGYSRPRQKYRSRFNGKQRL